MVGSLAECGLLGGWLFPRSEHYSKKWLLCRKKTCLEGDGGGHKRIIFQSGGNIFQYVGAYLFYV